MDKGWLELESDPGEWSFYGFLMDPPQSLLSARTAVWSAPVVLTETENENDSANQNDVAKMT